MPRTLEDEIIQLKNEMNALKAVYVKTASAVKTKRVELGLQTFTLNTVMPGEAYASARLKVTVDTRDGTNQLCDLTLLPVGAAENYNLNSRQPLIKKLQSGETTIFQVEVHSFNQNDIMTIIRGGTVAVQYNFAISGTSDFNATTEWILW